MKKPLFMVALAIWVLAGTLLLSRWWYANPDFFPRFPEMFWYQLDKLFGVSNVDGASDIELIVVILLALITVLTFTTLTLLIYRHFSGDRQR